MAARHACDGGKEEDAFDPAFGAVHVSAQAPAAIQRPDAAHDGDHPIEPEPSGGEERREPVRAEIEVMRFTHGREFKRGRGGSD